MADELAVQIADKRLAMRIAALAGIDLPGPYTGDVSDTWRQIVAAADRTHRIADLLDRAGTYAEHVSQRDEESTTEFEPVADPLAQPAWAVFDEPEMERYERRVGTRSTLLPVSFLRAGLVAARSVCKISSQRRDVMGVPYTVTGTGFLIGRDEVLTCFHVLPNAAAAAGATVEFNYETDESGAQLQSERVRLIPDHGFETSGSLTYDWTIVRTERAVGEQYGFLRLERMNGSELTFVNIIGHPHGQTKQVSLYDNLVEAVNPDRVLYTTETADGSSGSPVFDSQWRVVAMHNGWQRVFQRNMVRRVTRNAGININRIIERAGEFGRTEGW